MQKLVLLTVSLVSLVALASIISSAFVYDGGPTSDTFQPTIHLEGSIRAHNGQPLYREDDRVMGVKQPTYRMVAMYDGKIVGSGGALPIKYSLTTFTQLTTLNLWDKNLELYWGVYDETEPSRAKLIYCTTINLRETFGQFEKRDAWMDLVCADSEDVQRS